MFALSATSVTVPAGCDGVGHGHRPTGARGPTAGATSARSSPRATAAGSAVRTQFGLYLEDERHDLDIAIRDRSGRPLRRLRAAAEAGRGGRPAARAGRRVRPADGAAARRHVQRTDLCGGCRQQGPRFGRHRPARRSGDRARPRPRAEPRRPQGGRGDGTGPAAYGGPRPRDELVPRRRRGIRGGQSVPASPVRRQHVRAADQAGEDRGLRVRDALAQGVPPADPDPPRRAGVRHGPGRLAVLRRQGRH